MFCNELPSKVEPLRYEAISCSKYDDARKPDLDTLKQIAWRIDTDKKTGRIGFISPKDWVERGGSKYDD